MLELDRDVIITGRLDQGHTQADAAKQLGVSVSAFAAWERGARQPGPRNCKKLADYLGIKIHTLFLQRENNDV